MIEELMLVKPNYNLKNEYLDMIDEWEKSQEHLIPWSLNLDTNNFRLFIDNFENYSKGIELEPGFVESSTYWLINSKIGY